MQYVWDGPSLPPSLPSLPPSSSPLLADYSSPYSSSFSSPLPPLPSPLYFSAPFLAFPLFASCLIPFLFLFLDYSSPSLPFLLLLPLFLFLLFLTPSSTSFSPSNFLPFLSLPFIIPCFSALSYFLFLPKPLLLLLLFHPFLSSSPPSLSLPFIIPVFLRPSPIYLFLPKPLLLFPSSFLSNSPPSLSLPFIIPVFLRLPIYLFLPKPLFLSILILIHSPPSFATFHHPRVSPPFSYLPLSPQTLFSFHPHSYPVLLLLFRYLSSSPCFSVLLLFTSFPKPLFSFSSFPVLLLLFRYLSSSPCFSVLLLFTSFSPNHSFSFPPHSYRSSFSFLSSFLSSSPPSLRYLSSSRVSPSSPISLSPQTTPSLSILILSSLFLPFHPRVSRLILLLLFRYLSSSRVSPCFALSSPPSSYLLLFPPP
ncbi:hypothetical protein C7M84_022750 [Penaeus vannamei]|uniref:Uncharacterized protein n=1 Tax=Penaeus vannamei TaxID=6689 RepID=A0A3R7MKC7_PENVA|nr:hypothetical protein C7M84_022750 [Penaeus vannamei]